MSIPVLFWILVAVLFVAYTGTQVVGVFKRLVAVGRRMSDSRQLAELLGEDTREALRRAGLDPGTLKLDASLPPELRRRVHADLRSALHEAVHPSLGGLRLPGRDGPSLPAPPDRSAVPTLPPPYLPEPEAGTRLRLAAAALVIALAAAGILLTWR